jgi:hypothetical protein
LSVYAYREWGIEEKEEQKEKEKAKRGQGNDAVNGLYNSL